MKTLTAIPMNADQFFYHVKSDNDIFISFNGQKSTLHYFEYDLPIKNHNLVEFNGDSYVVPLDYLVQPTEYKKFRDAVDDGLPFKQRISGSSQHTVCSFVSSYCSGKIDYYVSPIEIIKKEIAGANRKTEEQFKIMSDDEFGDIFFTTIRKEHEQKQKEKKKKSLRNEMSLER